MLLCDINNVLLIYNYATTASFIQNVSGFLCGCLQNVKIRGVCLALD